MNVKGTRAIVERYVADLTEALAAIDPRVIERVLATLERARERKARIFIVGNGGSAATASHLCTDLGVGLRRRGHSGFDVQCLSDNAAITTAVANDIAYEEIFAAQLEGVIVEQDVLIALSASGESPNILRAVEVAREHGATVVGISGFDGGTLRRASDISLHVASKPGAYGLVEDMHLVFNHIFALCFAADATQTERAGEGLERSQPQKEARSRSWVRLGRRKRPGTPSQWDVPR